MRTLAFVASRSALDALEPLRAAYARSGHVVAVEEPDAKAQQLGELADAVDALLVVGPRRRSPRTALPGPVLRARGGRRVPVGWLPDAGAIALRRFALAAASVHERMGAGPPTVALLAQRSRRYRDLARRIERLLGEGEGVVRPLRWSADELLRPDLVRGLGFGLAAAVYVGHGRPVGWVGYGGTRAHHLAGGGKPLAALLSLTCLTASRRRVGLSFAESIVLGGGVASAFGAVCSTDHRWNARWALRLAGALLGGPTTLGDLVAAAEGNDPAVAGYRIVGDPLAPLADEQDAAARAESLTQAVALAA